jgi:hypothetical protein
MVKSINIHPANSITTILKPEGLGTIVNVKVILFSVASEKFRLSHYIISIINHVFIFLLNIFFMS